MRAQGLDLWSWCGRDTFGARRSSEHGPSANYSGSRLRQKGMMCPLAYQTSAFALDARSMDRSCAKSGVTSGGATVPAASSMRLRRQEAQLRGRPPQDQQVNSWPPGDCRWRSWIRLPNHCRPVTETLLQRCNAPVPKTAESDASSRASHATACSALRVSPKCASHTGSVPFPARQPLCDLPNYVSLSGACLFWASMERARSSRRLFS